jgi:predicted lipoprotein
MKKRMIALGVLAVLTVTLLVSGCGIVKVVKIGDEGKYTGEVEFNAGDDVAAIWEASAIPELNETAADLAQFLTESKGDLTLLADQYGKYSMGTSGELSYVVKGTGTVEEVNTESQAGYLTVKLDDYNGEEAIKIQVGPVYKGSSIRDSLSFIKFGDYKNQEEWAAVSQSINELVAKDVVEPVKPDSLQGKTVSFVGAFTVSTGSTDVLITPAVLEVQ